MLFFLLLAMVDDFNQAGIGFLRTYQNPMDVSDDYLAYPYAVDLDREGRLYVADRNQSRILVWNKDGTYLMGFAKKGEGPGEILQPLELSVIEGEVWVWDSRQSISIFATDGKFIEKVYTTGLFPRKMVTVNKETALLGTRAIDDNGNMGMRFSLFDRKTGKAETLKEWDNESFVTNISGSDGNTVTLKAFASEIDIQRDGKGMVYFGFSQFKNLYKMNDEGSIAAEWSFEIPDVKPTDEDRELIYSMSFPLPNGQRISLKSFPGIKILFDSPKAPYTHFLIKDGKALFVQTPIGSVQGVGNGFSQATYYINDLKTGKPLTTGQYKFPEDSMVFFRNGRIIACIVTGEDEFEIREMAIEGF